MVRSLEHVILIICLTCSLNCIAQDETKDPFGLNELPAIKAEDKAAELLAKDKRPSIVVITQEGRDGKISGTGTGFVISKDGLIATCAHVIGESRPISVRFADGTEYEVNEIFAWDRKLDLAILKIEATDLIALELAKANTAKQGAKVIAMGNPQGLEFSVVSGIISGLREIEGSSLIQIAIPIEPGNSGGPLMGTKGNVHGILNMKSAITENLGFAIPVQSLMRLLEKPNKIAMKNWLTIGQLNSAIWKPIMGANWKQRAGKIMVTKPGNGFGGRSICIFQKEIPEIPYEVKVEVKLNGKKGAAGLIFEADGKNKHYGFYPSEGNMRLTRFEGPDVLSWSILDQVSSESYRSEEWNRLRIRVEKEKIIGYLNGEKICELNDAVLRGGKVGLAKFRSTEAEFKHFELGKELSPKTTPNKTVKELTRQIDLLIQNPINNEAIKQLKTDISASKLLLQNRIKELNKTATSLKIIHDRVHREHVTKELIKELDKGIKSDLTLCALLIAQHDNQELDIKAYHSEINRMATDIKAIIDPADSEEKKVKAISKYLFEDNGYHGSRTDYYNRSNSYLNEVIDDREGIPITLSIIFIELASRINVELKGLGLPGHFVVFHKKQGERKIIDPFNGGKQISTEEADQIVQDQLGIGKASEYEPADNLSIVKRMIYNLKGITIDNKEYEDALNYVNLLIEIDPNDPQERLSRAILNIQNKQEENAKSDLEWLLKTKPEGIHLQRIQELYNRL
jgi:regulator of sirC expression with transglutaminase-like and TPR domain